MKKLTDGLQKAVTPKTLAIFLTIVYVGSLIPILMIARYNYPSADDYSIGSTCRQAWVASHSVFQVIRQAVLMAVNDWFHWMGYFTSIFLMAIHPGVIGEAWYSLTTWIMVGMLSFSTMYLLHAVFVKAFKADKYTAHCVSMLLLFISVQCMVGRTEAFFWYCGAVNYIFLHGMSLFFFGALVSAVYDKGKKRVWDIVIASFLGFFTGGGNQMTALNVAILLAVASALMIKQKRWKVHKALWIPFGFYFAGFILNIAAPGNWVRAEGASGMNPIKAVFVSFYYCLDYALSEWTGWPVIIMVAVMVPLFWHMAKKTSFQFAYPGIVALFGYCLVSAMVTPPLFAVGNIGAGRLQALMYLMYLLVLTLAAGYVTGWVRKRMERYSLEKRSGKQETERFSANQAVCILGGLLFFAIAAGITVIPEPHYFTASSAAADLANGSARAYGEALKERAEIYNSGTEGIIEVPPLPAKPGLLYFSDITTDSEAWENRGLARYYQKEGVVVKEEMK